MKLIKLFEEVLGEAFRIEPNPSCDCCKYFDFTFSQEGGKFNGLERPLYYEISKSERQELKYIKPKQYIYAIARGFGGLSYADVVDSGAVSKDKVKEYAQAMQNGNKFPIPWYKNNETGQEGRHRALAAISLGCETIPVVVMSTLSYNEKLELAKSYKDLSREELNQIFINRGYNGITDLGWKDLQRFIEYNVK